jgi:ribosomal protein S18 acetylase RimI-like enzyme
MIRPFTDADLDAAAALLAERHARHRAREPLLPEADARAEVEALWGRDGAVGAIAADGFMLATRNDERIWGPNAWVELAGHAARDPELVRDLYAFLYADFPPGHFVWVPAGDAALLDAWFRLGFGAQQAFGVLEIPAAELPDGCRRATRDDLEELVALEPVLHAHQAAAPVFSRVPPRAAAEIRKELVEEVDEPTIANFLFERDGRVLGNFTVCPIELSSAHSSLARVPGAALLAFAAVYPEARGTGAGVALTQACFAWAREQGYTTMVTDWRATNLAASRFWPKRGFRETFLRLHRHVA